jgi:hypothetical protein
MRQLSSPFVWIFASVMALGASGCFSRQLVNFSTHSDKETVLMQTFDSRNYLVWSKHEHVYWSCTESGDTLECTRRCGGKTDLICPEFAIFANSVGTNVR